MTHNSQLELKIFVERPEKKRHVIKLGMRSKEAVNRAHDRHGNVGDAKFKFSGGTKVRSTTKAGSPFISISGFQGHPLRNTEGVEVDLQCQ